MFEHVRAGARHTSTAPPHLSTYAILDHAPVLATGVDGRVLWASAAAYRLLGTAAGTSLLSAVDATDRDRLRQEFRRMAVTPDAQRRTEFRLGGAGGEGRYLEADIARVVDDHGQPTLVLCLHDMSARFELERELYHRALHDPLTALPNRALLEDRLEQAVARLRRAQNDEALVVLYVDVDHFKRVNDTHGHEGGDRVVREVARRLLNAVRPGDTVGRVGGDEFVIVCPDTTYAVLDDLANRLSVVIAEPIVIAGKKLRVTASIGIAVANEPGTLPAQLLREADAAMYRAKRAGRGRVMLGFPES
jgi:diguanylate cyclase (GGDEF)-like protein